MQLYDLLSGCCLEILRNIMASFHLFSFSFPSAFDENYDLARKSEDLYHIHNHIMLLLIFHIT